MHACVCMWPGGWWEGGGCIQWYRNLENLWILTSQNGKNMDTNENKLYINFISGTQCAGQNWILWAIGNWYWVFSFPLRLQHTHTHTHTHTHARTHPHTTYTHFMNSLFYLQHVYNLRNHIKTETSMWCGLIEGSTDEIHAHVLLIFFFLHHILAGTLPKRTRLTLHTHFPNIIVFHTVLVSEHCPFMHPLTIFPSLTLVSLSHKFHINSLLHRLLTIFISCPLVYLSHKFHTNTLLYRLLIIFLSCPLVNLSHKSHINTLLHRLLTIFLSCPLVNLSHKFHINTLLHRPPIIILSCPLVNLSYKFHINTLLHRPPIIILSCTLLGINVPQTFVKGIPLHLANSILLHTHST